MTPPAPGRGRRWPLAAVGAALTLVAACGGGGDADPEAGGPSSSSSSTTSAAGASGGCDELESLDRSEEITPELIAEAPEQIRAPLEVLAEVEDLGPESAPAGSARRVLGAQAAVDSWDHEHCGGEHPFCTLYLTASYAIASTALAGEEEANEELEVFLDEVDDLLSEHAPNEVREEVETFLAFLEAPSDEEERTAEEASDALDAWAWEEGCAGASPPDEQE